ncbi:hypothetical protein ACH4CE_22740 [Streptomyces gelaticus]|uniref:hypothetical protein n=1 Tax=Streptomyces gelaticus TaxID=285446 RepID=UPI003792F6E4
MRRSCYRGQPKAHLQHVLTAIAVNIERLNGRDPPTKSARPGHRPRSRHLWTRTASPGPNPGGPTAPDLNRSKLPDRVNAPDEPADAPSTS